MQFEEQTAAVRQMKELLRDQAKFRAKLDRVVRKIETSSERTAKLAERNKTRKQNTNHSHTRKQQQQQQQPTPEFEHSSDNHDHEQNHEHAHEAAISGQVA